MTIGKFKELVKDLPDDTNIVLFNGVGRGYGLYNNDVEITDEYDIEESDLYVLPSYGESATKQDTKIIGIVANW